jgi:hypothetical protein
MAHPFVRRNPLVRARIEAELAAAAASSASGSPSAAAAAFIFDRRRLVRPAGVAAAAPSPAAFASSPAASSTAPAGAAALAAPGSQRYQRRLAPTCRELMYVYDGDPYGVVHHIATDYGTRGWVNPALARRVEVRASSPASRFTNPQVRARGTGGGQRGGCAGALARDAQVGGPRRLRAGLSIAAAPSQLRLISPPRCPPSIPSPQAIVGGTFPRTSYACPRYEGGQPSSWWLVDLGPTHRWAGAPPRGFTRPSRADPRSACHSAAGPLRPGCSTNPGLHTPLPR